MPRIRPIRAALAALAIPASAWAQAPTVSPPVVVTATRVEQSSFDLPVSIDVVDAGQLQDGQFRVNTSEALARVPGIVAPSQSRYSSDQQVSSRGFGARSAFGIRGIRLYADGIPQSMPDGQGQTGTFNLSSAERMEVMRGPFSALYGNSSGGVIQIFTRDGPETPTLSPDVYGGSFDTWRAGVQLGGQSGSLNYLIDASRFQTDGYREHSAARRDHINGKFTFRPGPATKVVLVVNYLDQPYNEDPQGLTRAEYEADPRQAGGAAVAFDTGGSKSQTHAGVHLEHSLDDRNTVRATAWAGTREALGRLGFAGGGPLSSGGISMIERKFGGIDARWTHRMPTAAGPLTITAGLDYEHMEDARTGFVNNNGAQGALRRDEDNIVWNFDQYIQAEWQLGRDWILSGGVRHSQVEFENRDRYIVGPNPDDSGKVKYSSTNPVIGVVYHLTAAVNLYANAGKGFETPTFIELAYSPPPASGPNFGLQPSTSKNYEVGIKAFLGSSTRANLALFDVRTDREIVVATSAGGRTTYQNAGRTSRRGVELSIDSDLTESVKAYLAYTLLDAKFDDGFGAVQAGNRLPGAPRVAAFGELSWRYAPAGFTTAVEAQYSGKVYVDDINSDAADSYAVVNWRGGFEQRFGGWRLREFVRVDNIFDKKYVGGVAVNNAAPFFAAPGRNYLAGIGASFAF